MLGRNIINNLKDASIIYYSFTFGNVLQCNNYIIIWVNLQNFITHATTSLFNCTDSIVCFTPFSIIIFSLVQTESAKPLSKNKSLPQKAASFNTSFTTVLGSDLFHLSLN